FRLLRVDFKKVLRRPIETTAFTRHNALELSFAWHERTIPGHMAPDEARHLVIEGINYAAYHETDFSLQDSDKNRLFGSEHYESGLPVREPSRWSEGDF